LNTDFSHVKFGFGVRLVCVWSGFGPCLVPVWSLFNLYKVAKRHGCVIALYCQTLTVEEAISATG